MGFRGFLSTTTDLQSLIEAEGFTTAEVESLIETEGSTRENF